MRTGRCLSLEVASRGMGIDSESQENRIEIRRLIAEKCEVAKRLPARERLLFLMYYDHGHSLEAIGKLCGISEGAVSRRLKKISDKIDENENSGKGD